MGSSTRPGTFFLFVLLSPVAQAASAAQDCAETLAALERLDGSLHREWHETTMTDGRPLVFTLSEENGALRLVFHKTGEGLWADGRAKVCQRGAALEAQLTSASPGPAAPWLLRQTLGRSPVFLLKRNGSGDLHVSTPGWSGSFIPKQDRQR